MLRFAALAIATATVVVSWLRLFIGVDLTDEAFYVTLPYRFALGDLPVRDEQNLTQFAGYLLTPLVRLSLWLNDGTDQLMLFMRHGHLLFTCIVGAVVYWASRALLPRSHALLTACLCVAFVPFNIHGLSYNTLGSGFLTMGMFLAFGATGGRGRPVLLLWWLAGTLHALAALAYPTLPVALIAFAAIAFTSLPSGRRKAAFLAYAAGALLVALLPLTLLYAAGWSSIREIGVYLAADQGPGRGLAKFGLIAMDFWNRAPHLDVLIGAVTALALLHRLPAGSGRLVRIVLALMLGVFCLRPNGTASLYIVTAIALLAPFLQWASLPDESTRQLMRTVWWPAAACGIVTAWTSSNGAMNASIGLFPAMLVSVMLIQHALLRPEEPSARWRNLNHAVAAAAPSLVVVALLLGGWVDFYGERYRAHWLTWPVERGPFKGISTFIQKRDQLHELHDHVLPKLRAGDSSFTFDGLPAAYLLLGVRPKTNSVWAPVPSPRPDRTPVLRYWQAHGLPTVVFVTGPGLRAGDPLSGVLGSGAYEKVANVGLGTLLRQRADQPPQGEDTPR